jgi:very-short-patch-repair endonuclease
MYVAGESAQNAAQRFHTTEITLRALLKERGLWRDRATMQAIRSAKVSATVMARSGLPIGDITARYLAGESENALAHAFGVDRSTIKRRLKVASTQRRSNTIANRLLRSQTPRAVLLQRISKAQEATRGRKQTIAHREKIAATREVRLSNVSAAEILLCGWLAERGIASVPQKAVGPYNLDVGASPIAIEVFGGNWHASKANHIKRARYLFNAGWHLVVIWVHGTKSPLTPECADYIVAFLQEARSHPSMIRQYRVLLGGGQEVARGRANDDHISLVMPRRRTNRLRS